MKFFKFFLSLFFIFISLLFFLLIIKEVYLPDLELLGEKIVSGGIELYDRSGKVLLYKTGLRHFWVDFENIPQRIIQTTLIAEDEDFYKHHGFSLKGILRSIYLNLKTRSLVYGGSTITQQLARNLFLNREKTLWRKIQEILIALELERKYSKNEILTYYLNSIYYGEGNIGIRAAAEYYFDKKLKDLTWSEAAILAAIPKAPAIYAPISKENIKNLKERRDYLLRRLKEKNIITEEEYKKSISEEIKIIKTKYAGMIAPHFVIEVMQELQKIFSNKNLEELNLKVITTLDYDLQKIAERVIKQGAEKNKEKYGGSNAALMAIDPKTGEVLTLVGSKDFFDESIDGQVNVPFRKRQPGSAFKPIVYAALFELGYPDKTIIFDAPTDFGNYKPKNFDEVFKGPVSLRQALAESRNVPSVKVLYLAGPERVIELSKKAGMDYLRDWKSYGLSLGLGTAEIRMADLIRFYGALANDGKLVSQTMILKIIQDNKIIYEYQPEEKQIISQETARILNDILKDIRARSGLFSASLKYTIFPGYEVALKTGTTQFYQDAWAFGYTPNIVVGVWAGNTDGRRMNSLGASLVAALPIFHQFLSSAIELNKIPQENFLPPPERNIDKPMLNGKWLTEYGVHDILFYVKKENPLGSFPENPYDDSQFYNWEKGVQIWLANNPG
jgi:1A family penicillin-binding protein